MGIDEKERERAILDVTVELLLRHGYNKVTMSDVADAVGLNRRLVYLLFPSKDALTPSILAALSSHTKTPLDDSARPDQPSFDELVETVAELCECLLTPQAGANLEAGKALMRRKIAEVQAQLTERNTQ